jgi:hypothetical protein
MPQPSSALWPVAPWASALRIRDCRRAAGDVAGREGSYRKRLRSAAITPAATGAAAEVLGEGRGDAVAKQRLSDLAETLSGLAARLGRTGGR